MGAAPLLWGLLALLTPGVCGQCRSPQHLNFAILLNSTSVFNIGDNLVYECRPGYMKKRFIITCLQNSVWSNAKNICERKLCPTPEDIPNGKVEATGSQFGSTIKYSCSEGYQLIGSSSNQCILSGNTVVWEKEVPVCERIRCAPPPNIPNGRYRNTDDYFFYGMVVSYECDTGRRGEKLYDLVGNKTLYCTTRDNNAGIWNSPPPRCINLVKCQIPEIPNGKRVSGFRPQYSLNDAVEFECNPGFTMKGKKVVRCQTNRQWEPALPVCFKGCLPPVEISHGKINKITDQFSFGESVSYVCEPGYSLVGPASIKCLESGKWSHETTKCEVKSCGNFLGKLTNGRVKLPPLPQLGTKVFFYCNEGFRLEGSPSSTCVLSGKRVHWNNQLPSCKNITCNSPPPIINGRLALLSGNTFPYGNTFRYTCNRGFRIIGPSNTRCTSENQMNGVWSIPAPRCEAYKKTVYCTEPKELGRHLKLMSRSPYRHGDTLKFSCDANFTIKGDNTLWCQADGTWGPSPMPTCKSDFLIDCPAPPMIPNGQHSGGPFTPGLSVTYSCERGYLLIGEKTIHCLPSGVWNATAPKCKEALCEPLIRFPNGQVEEPSHVQIGAIMTFSCNKGYHLQGQSSSQCVPTTEGAVWTEIPVCVEMVCPPPPLIENGSHTGSSTDDVPYGTKVIYRCNADPEKGVKFNLIGESTLQCISDEEGNAIWSATAPHCEPSASHIECLHPSVPNGHHISAKGPPYVYNTSVTFRCNTGFTLRGSSQIRCSANGTWDPAVPVCEKACQPPPGIIHGQHTGRNVGLLDPGTSVSYSCDLGYSLIGEETIYCSAEGVWKPVVPVCKANLCPPPPLIENGSHTGSSTDDVPYGTKVIYRCNADPEKGVKFNLIGESTLQCISDKEGNAIWSATAPRCEPSASHIECLHPSVPNGHHISAEGPPYIYNGSVTFRCNTGYTLNGSSQIWCGDNGTWVPAVPVCEKACQPPPGIIHGQHTGRNVGLLDPGTSVSYSCDLGYSLIGEETIYCSAEGVWKPVVPVCKANLCPPPPLIENGSHTGSSTDDVPYGTKVIYRCNADPEKGVKFNLIGESTLQCISDKEGNAIWSATAPRCEPSASHIECLHPSVPNGHHISAEGPPYIYNGSVTFRCNTGYTLNGSSQIWCGDNGTWVPAVPVCEKACQPPPGIIHGQHTGRNVGLLDPGTSVSYSCDLGYSLIGEETIYCSAEGVWKPVVPVCKANLCPPPPLIENGSHTGSSTDDVPYGTKVIYRCNADPEKGVKFNLIGESTLQCISDKEGNAIWSATAPRCEPSASHIECLHPSVPNGHHISAEGPPYIYNGSVTFRCNTGYTLNGSSQIWCGDNGTWVPAVPVCEKACQPPPGIIHGQHTGRNVGLLDPGTSVSYSCDLGYSLIGEETIYCSAEGVWKPVVPVCKANLCPPPPLIENGSHTGSSTDDVPYGTKVIYRCNADPEKGVKFNLIGESTLQCISDKEGNAIWSATAPRCEPSASHIECLHPSVPNGHHISAEGPPYIYNGSVTFRCNTGYTLNGSSQIWCGDNGTWVPAVPVCEKACQPPPGIIHGQHTGRNVGLLDPGTSVSYSCDLGYSLIGEGTIYCSAEGVWKPVVPVCKAILCPPPPLIENGSHTGSTTDDVPYGTKVIYKCNADPEKGVKFILIGESTLQCISDKEGNAIWSATAPRCEPSASHIECLHPNVPNGHHISAEGPPYIYNASVTFRCHTGFILNGSSQIRCSANGTWDPAVPVCEKACQPPPGIIHGQHTGRIVGLLDPGTSVSYSCDLGYSLIGEETIYCSAEGVWKPVVPVCKANLCPPPPLIENGSHTGSSTDDVPYGTKVIYRCNADPEKGVKFNLIGESTLQCISDKEGNAIWSATAPRCEPSASHIECLHPSVPNGHHISAEGPPYIYNGSVTFRCNTGYTLNGSSQIWCGDNGTWVPAVPVCEKEVNCSLPEFISGAQNVSTKKIYNFGAIFTLKCDEGYILEGSPQSQCQEDHEWDPPLAVCKSQNFSSFLGYHGPVVLSGILLGTILLIVFVGVTLIIISKHKEGNYFANEKCKEVAIQLETRETHNSDAYSIAT